MNAEALTVALPICHEQRDWSVPAVVRALKPQVAALVRAAKVLIIDEIGYLPHAADAANVLCSIVEARHCLRRPMIHTTNKPLKQWASSCTTPTSPRPSSTASFRMGRHIDLWGRSWRTGRTDDYAADPALVGAAANEP